MFFLRESNSNSLYLESQIQYIILICIHWYNHTRIKLFKYREAYTWLFCGVSRSLMFSIEYYFTHSHFFHCWKAVLICVPTYVLQSKNICYMATWDMIIFTPELLCSWNLLLYDDTNLNKMVPKRHYLQSLIKTGAQ